MNKNITKYDQTKSQQLIIVLCTFLTFFLVKIKEKENYNKYSCQLNFFLLTLELNNKKRN